MRITVNSEPSLSQALGEVREAYRMHRYITVTIRAGKGRSIDQNAISFAWYEQLGRELREDDARGWRRYCKLHHGVPILRAEDADFREGYDAVIKPLSYERKLIAMDHWPVSSLMTTPQLSKYLEAVQADFRLRGVFLEFPEKDAA